MPNCSFYAQLGILSVSSLLGKNQFDEASRYHSKQFKVHVAVTEMINLRDEMDTIITQKYKNDQEMPEKKRKHKIGM